ncbi:MAG: UDP-N-acetylmuramoyl-tripeptide--D-alanyl-D-alanine ligase [Candidatus Paceibacterota bacterium]
MKLDKRFLRKQLKNILAFTASLFLKKYKPLIVGVTGSVGKTSTKEAVYSVVRTEKRARRNHGNFNTEFGFPLTIFGDYTEAGRGWFWFFVLLRSWTHLLLPEFIAKYFYGRYPEVLVLEYAADKPGDIGHLVKIAPPNIAVVTAIGEVPVHVEFYKNPDEVAREKSRILTSLNSANHAILNADEERVRSLAEKTKAAVTTFGFSENADVKVSGFETKLESAGRGMPKRPVGISFKLENNGNFVPIRIGGTLGKSQAFAAAAAAAVGLRLGINLVQIADAFTYFQVPNQRVKLVAGVKESYVVDDSYNASPIATELAIETLSEIKAKRKIAVLGDMLELGEFSKGQHEKIGRLAASVFDVLITVGSISSDISHAAIEAGMPKGKVFHLETADEAEALLVEMIKKGDLILIKGSKAVGLKKVAEAARLGKIVF